MSEPDAIGPGLIAIVQRALGDVRALLREEVRREVELQVQLALVLAEVAKSPATGDTLPTIASVIEWAVDPARAVVAIDAAGCAPPVIVAKEPPTLLDDVEAFMVRHGMGAERFGQLFCNQKTLVWTLRKGRKPGVLVSERIRRFMREYRPAAAVARQAEPAQPVSNADTLPIVPPALPEDDGGEGLAEFARALEMVRDKPIEIVTQPPIDTAQLAAAFERHAKAKAARVMLPPTRVPRFQGMRWCEQCAQRVAWAKAESCQSQFCKVDL